MNYDPSKIASSWIIASESNQSSKIYKDNYWAIEIMVKLPEDDPLLSWEIINRVLDSTDNKKSLDYLAAGPFELLMCSHGEKFLDLLKEKAKISKFQELMQGVVLTKADTPIWEEFYKLAGIEPPISNG